MDMPRPKAGDGYSPGRLHTLPGGCGPTTALGQDAQIGRFIEASGISNSGEAMLHPRYLRPQRFLHVLQGKAMHPVIKGGPAVCGHLHRVVPVAGISYGMQNADIGAHPAHDQPLRTQLLEPFPQEGAVEGAVFLLGITSPE